MGAPRHHLTARQEAFAVAYAKCRNASDAYRAAGYSLDMTPKSINEQGCRILKIPNVAARIWELGKVVQERGALTLQEHIANLEHLRNLATQDGQYGAAVAAEKQVGVVSGHVQGTPAVINQNLYVQSQAPDLQRLDDEEIARLRGVRQILDRIASGTKDEA
jgi:hypothetical protein